MTSTAPQARDLAEKREISTWTETQLLRDAVLSLRRTKTYTQTAAVILVLFSLVTVVLFIVALFMLHSAGGAAF